MHVNVFMILILDCGWKDRTTFWTIIGDTRNSILNIGFKAQNKAKIMRKSDMTNCEYMS